LQSGPQYQVGSDTSSGNVRGQAGFFAGQVNAAPPSTPGNLKSGPVYK